ncbi:RHS repeat-associated core domain-containing protein [Pseudomonas fluorescens]|uniref:RHS repeat-associated core domain-containing protein n=1 Tax=Pseudomonas fluorescens TaxID=294 RepID=A0A5E7FSK2_PSEFL|nr:RHS repeat-associated core domain-containing protein [Pseudomonas fluorescens]VVO42155.1 hypothetical protein PS723_05973 [Pseudomonas fluorescens]
MPAPRQAQGSPRSPATNVALSRTLLLATDLQQSILAELDRSDPNRLVYTAYGSQSGQRTAGSHLGFNGQLRERPTGCYHLGNGHRVYNPVLMRFHSPDRLSPFGKGGMNPYVYCVGNPVNFADPSGQVPEWLQPVLTIGLHIGIIAATVVTAVMAPPAGLALWAARTSLVGSPVAIGGSVMQLAGAKEEGKIVSAIGTAFSIGAVATRTGVGIKNWLIKPDRGSHLRNGLRNLFGVKKKPTSFFPGVTPRRSIVERSGSSFPGQRIDDLEMTRIRLSSMHSAGTETKKTTATGTEIRNGAVHYVDLDGNSRIFRPWA